MGQTGPALADTFAGMAMAASSGSIGQHIAQLRMAAASFNDMERAGVDRSGTAVSENPQRWGIHLRPLVGATGSGIRGQLLSQNGRHESGNAFCGVSIPYGGRDRSARPDAPDDLGHRSVLSTGAVVLLPSEFCRLAMVCPDAVARFYRLAASIVSVE